MLSVLNDRQIRRIGFVENGENKWDMDMAVEEVQTIKDLTHTNTIAITKQEATNRITTFKLQKTIPNKSEI